MSEAVQTEGIAAMLNRLPFVRWDRCVIVPDGDITVYGWIERHDAHADFVILTFDKGRPDWVGFFTSSSIRTDEIHRLLYGDDADASHYPCQRVEHVFGDTVAEAVRLRAAPR